MVIESFNPILIKKLLDKITINYVTTFKIYLKINPAKIMIFAYLYFSF